MSQQHKNRDAWEDYYSNQKFEHELINRKTTWLLTSQTVMFAAYGVALESGCDKAAKFGTIVSVTAIFVALIMFVGVIAVIRSKKLSFNEYRSSFDPEAEWGIETRTTIASLVPDGFLPLVFAVVWTWLLLW